MSANETNVANRNDRKLLVQIRVFFTISSCVKLEKKYGKKVIKKQMEKLLNEPNFKA